MKKATFLKVFGSSFFMQSSWSFEKMQSLGFACAMAPALDEIYGHDEKARKEAFKRHIGFYNAHPYMASPVLGAAINLEEKVRAGEVGQDAASTFKKRVMAPYGAVGDAFYWGSIRPLASCAGVAAAVLWGMWGPVLFLLFYNLFHLWMRWQGLRKGYAMGPGVVEWVKSLRLPEWGYRAKNTASALLGAVTALVLIKAATIASDGMGTWYFMAWLASGVVLSAAATGILYILMKKGMSAARLFYVVILPLIILAVTGN